MSLLGQDYIVSFPRNNLLDFESIQGLDYLTQGRSFSVFILYFILFLVVQGSDHILLLFIMGELPSISSKRKIRLNPPETLDSLRPLNSSIGSRPPCDSGELSRISPNWATRVSVGITGSSSIRPAALEGAFCWGPPATCAIVSFTIIIKCKI